MVPKIFSDDITYWRKWREEVAKYFDEEKEGMKAVMDDVAKQTMPITKEVMEEGGGRRRRMREEGGRRREKRGEEGAFGQHHKFDINFVTCNSCL